MASVPRVEGMLAVSRALGDFDLEDKGVTWLPHIRIVPRYRSKGAFIPTCRFSSSSPTFPALKLTSGVFLIMATDGVWECINDDEACAIVDEELKFSIPTVCALPLVAGTPLD